MVLASENSGESGECACVRACVRACVAEIRRSFRPLAAFCLGANTIECYSISAGRSTLILK